MMQFFQRKEKFPPCLTLARSLSLSRFVIFPSTPLENNSLMLFVRSLTLSLPFFFFIFFTKKNSFSFFFLKYYIGELFSEGLLVNTTHDGQLKSLTLKKNVEHYGYTLRVLCVLQATFGFYVIQSEAEAN